MRYVVRRNTLGTRERNHHAVKRLCGRFAGTASRAGSPAPTSAPTSAAASLLSTLMSLRLFMAPSPVGDCLIPRLREAADGAVERRLIAHHAGVAPDGL